MNDNHVTYVFVLCLNIFYDFCCFYVVGTNELSLFFNPSTSKLCIQDKILAKVLKIIIYFT